MSDWQLLAKERMGEHYRQAEHARLVQFALKGDPALDENIVLNGAIRPIKSGLRWVLSKVRAGDTDNESANLSTAKNARPAQQIRGQLQPAVPLSTVQSDCQTCGL